MAGIPSHLSTPLRNVLANCEQFETNNILRAVFADERLKPWRNSLPQVDVLQGRVDAVISLLHDKYRRDGSNVLVLLLRVLNELIDQEDERHHELATLADELEQTLGGPTFAPQRPVIPGNSAKQGASPPSIGPVESAITPAQPKTSTNSSQPIAEGSQQPEEVKMIDFFISYNRHDRQWAEWIAWQLEEAGYTTIIQAWDFRPGGNFVTDMQRATTQAERTIAVLSPNYLASRFTQPEWNAAFAQDPTGEQGLLLPVRVRECELLGLLPQIVYIDLVGLDTDMAKRALLVGVKRGRAKPSSPPGFPGLAGTQPDFPGEVKE